MAEKTRCKHSACKCQTDDGKRILLRRLRAGENVWRERQLPPSRLRLALEATD